VGAAADEGICELWASREAGLSPERVKYEELTDTAIEAAFGRERQKPVNPMVRRADLLKVLEHYETPPAPAPAKIKRDTPLREALMYGATGQWGLNPMSDGGSHLEALGAALRDFRQHAHDGEIAVWGRIDNYGVWTSIDREYWIDHYVDFLDVLKDKTNTKSYSKISSEPLFRELMVSRHEFATNWRKG